MKQFVENWSKYLESSSIHGLIYLSRRKSTRHGTFIAHQIFDLLHDQYFTEATNTSHFKHVSPTLRKYFFDDGFASTVSTFRGIIVVPFTKLLTKWGICLNFNLKPMESMLHTDKVTSDFFYVASEWAEAYRTGRTDPSLPWETDSKFIGLVIQRSASDSQNDYQPFQGSRVIIHNTDEFPFRTGQHVQHKIEEMIFIQYTPSSNIIDEKLKSWPPEQRNCFLENERKLKYFKIYTRMNCEHECLSEAIFQECECVPFYMIRSPSDRICGVADRHCYSMLEIKFDFYSCDCLQRCDQLSYSLEINHYRRALETSFVLYPRVTFFRPSVRYLAFDVYDFMAEFGGLMGLLAGISVFSIVELIMTIVKCFGFAACRTKVAPETALRPRNRRMFLVNKEHLFYHLGQTFAELLQGSNIHGVRFTNDKNLKVIERIFWLITVCVLLAFCSVLVFNSLNDLQSNSVIVTLDEKIWNVEDIPFPVISFCPDLNQHVLYEHLVCLEQNTCAQVDRQDLLTMMTTIYAGAQVCATTWLWWIERDFRNELVQSDYKNMSFTDHLEYLLNPNWAEENSFCMDGEPEVGATEVYAGGGLCFILNSKDKIYSQSAFQHVRGNYTAKCMHSARIKNGMTVELSGYKPRLPEPWAWGAISPWICNAELGILHVHTSEMFLPVIASYGHHNLAYFLVVTPKITTSDESSRNFHPNERNCYFDDERKLKYFNNYSRGNCLEECYSDRFHKMCGCVPYFIVHSINQTICLDSQRPCVSGLQSNLLHETSAAFKGCDCLSDCNSVEYTFMRVDARMTSDSVTKYIDVNGSVPLEGLVSIYFGSDEYTGFKRYASYNTVSLLSNIGGFLGLFLGISLFSFIETIYFFTLRFFNNLWF